MTIASVVVDAPLPQPLEYTVPAEWEASDLIGRCCVVPLGRRQVTGVVVERAERSRIDAARLRPLIRVIDEIGPLGAHWRALTRFAADYYQHPWGEVALPALPPALREPPGPRLAGSIRRWRAGFVGAASDDGAATLALTPEQAEAVAAINATEGFAPHLLHGVTGSGKTEVYLEAASLRLQRSPDAQVLLLVPEINLTPQFEARVRARHPNLSLAVLHSGLPAGERMAHWLAAHEGRARLVLGTRLAVFASLPGLALVVVDEEHDASFKAGDGVRYSARDLAIKRAQLAKVPVVLGSATPSLEIWAHAVNGRYRLLTLGQRPHAAQAERAHVRMIDTRVDRPRQGLCDSVRAALAATVARGEQALVFINRRGYAPVIACGSCGWLSNCARCSTFAAFHKGEGRLRCHHCGWQARLPSACPTCGDVDLQAVGHGTQRIEEALKEALPTARIARLDRDSTRGRDAGRNALQAVHEGAIDVLVGTQMIAKGHDFRSVTLVAVLNADAQLAAPDFRAPERLFATLMQVAGRAGRAGAPSEVLVQTRYPTHPLLQALARGDYAAFAQRQLQERAASQLPPFVHQALLTCEARLMAHALELLQAARELMAAPAEVRLFDPVPMPLERLAGRHRAQLLVESPARAPLQSFLAAWLPQVAAAAAGHRPRLRVQIEVDPQYI